MVFKAVGKCGPTKFNGKYTKLDTNPSSSHLSPMKYDHYTAENNHCSSIVDITTTVLSKDQYNPSLHSAGNHSIKEVCGTISTHQNSHHGNRQNTDIHATTPAHPHHFHLCPTFANPSSHLLA